MESNLQNKLQQFTENPPERVWQKISNDLDSPETFSQRLYQYEEQPPLPAWDAIESALERKEESPATVVSLTDRFRKRMRYAAVACFLGVILVAVTLTVRRTEAGSVGFGRNKTVAANQTDRPGTAVAQSTDPQTNKATRYPETNSTKKQKATSLTAARGETAPNRPAVITSGAYVTFSDVDGSIRKVSKKMAGFINCGETDLACKQRLQKLRQKMASTAITSDFTGVLDMLRQLQ